MIFVEKLVNGSFKKKYPWNKWAPGLTWGQPWFAIISCRRARTGPGVKVGKKKQAHKLG